MGTETKLGRESETEREVPRKRLDKVERLERPQEEGTVRFRFETRRRTGDDVLITEGLTKGYGERILFKDLKMHVRAGDRIALIGDNGTGKSTLLKCLIGTEKPDGGVIRWGTGVDLGYYDQHQSELHENKTVLDEVWDRFPRMEQYEVRGALGLFLFTGDEVFAPISTLSGGEKGRVALTELMLRKDNVLLLDEPTNHLDMDSREVLENALSDFPGTIISVSHDRYFINRFAEKVWVLDGNEIKEYLGNYDSYVLKVSRDQAPDGDGSPQQTRTALDKEKRRSREEEKKLREQKEALKAVEQSIARAEQDAGKMEAALADPEIWKDPEKAAETTRQYNALKDEIERLYEQYDALESAL